MSTGTIMLIGISVVVIGDYFIALYFRSLADRVEMGEKVSITLDPAGARKMATAMLVMAPLMWIVFALISFGVIPAHGIDPIKF